MDKLSLPRIISLETAVPGFSLAQSEVWELFNKHRKLSETERILYGRFLADKSISTRHVACDDILEIFDQTPDQLHDRYEKFAVQLATEALQKSCRSAGITPKQLDGLIVTTCTGYLCPGLTSYISGALGLNTDLMAYDLIGHGCGAALPALRLAKQLLAQQGFQHVAVVSAEICTAAISWGDAPDLILSNAIFGDGAAAAIVSNRHDTAGITLNNFESLLWPCYRDELRFTQKDSRLCNVLSKNVPAIVAKGVRELYDSLQPKVQAPVHYAFHTGGRRILDAVSQGLDITTGQMVYSRDVLRRYGNMSSPSILFVIKEMLDRRVFENQDSLLLFGFGAGFTAYGMCGQWIQPVQAERKEHVNCKSCCR